MQLTSSYLDIVSTLSSTMRININWKDTLFEWADLTTIRGESTFKTPHKLRNKN